MRPLALRLGLLAVCAGLLAACTTPPPHTSLAVTHVPSSNMDARRPNFVIIHHTSDNILQEALTTLTSPKLQVSAHYLIARDGAMVQMVEENARAWHAGTSYWGGLTDINSASIGIELDNNGNEPFADAQIDALLALLADIRQRYRIPPANFIGHSDVAPGRKDDPSILFPWKRLAANGFGLWCDVPVPEPAPGLDLALALAALGYNPFKPDASRQAFHQHFVQNMQTDDLPGDQAMAACLLAQKKAHAGE